MKIKQILLITCIFLPFMTKAEMYFEVGTKWVSEYISTSTPDCPKSEVSITMEQTNNPDPELALGFYGNSSYYDNTLFAYVKVEGERVYVRSITDNDVQWYLIYDFGLQPGAGNYFYMPLENQFTGNVVKRYLRCNSISKTEEFGDWDVMAMEEFEDESCEQSYGEGYWIKGLSSERGVLDNMYFDASGVLASLIAVYHNDKVIFKPLKVNVESLAKEMVISVNGKNIRIPDCTPMSRGIISSVDGIVVRDFVIGVDTEINIPVSGLYVMNICGNSQVLKIKAN